MGIQALTHIGITVSDLERSATFYCDGLGFTPVTRFETSTDASARLCEIPGMELECLFIERDGVRIELMHFKHPGHLGDPECRPMNRLGLAHLALRVDDLEGVASTLVQLGAEVRWQTRTGSAETIADVVFLTDPDGVRIELISLPGDPMTPLGEPCQSPQPEGH